jgi:hypothetical protein
VLHKAAINDHRGESPALGEIQRQSEATYRELDRRQLTVSIVQALNRIRCRRVTDAEGNCPTAEAFILLPSREGLGVSILDAIKAEMPGVVVKDWAFTMDAPATSLRQGSSHLRLVAYLRAMKPGSVTFTHLREELGLSPKGMEKLSASIRDPSTPLAKALQEAGIAHVRGEGGRGSSPTLVKVAA